MKERPNLDELIEEIQKTIYKYNLPRNINVGTLMNILYFLKEQGVKKPIYNEEKYGDHLPHCSSCEKVLPSISQYGKAKFCPNCGRAVTWDA